MCVADFEFFLIEEQEGLREPIDGVLGLARNKPFFVTEETDGQSDFDSDRKLARGPSYIMALKNADLINETTFAF